MATRRTTSKKKTTKRTAPKKAAATPAAEKKAAAKRAAPKKTATKRSAQKKAPAKRSTTRRTTKRVERIDPTPVKTAPPVLTVPRPLTRVFAPISEQPATPPPVEAPKGELITFAPDEWIALTYEGESMFCHPEAGVFVRGTTTRLRGSVARELAAEGQFKARRAA